MKLNQPHPSKGKHKWQSARQARPLAALGCPCFSIWISGSLSLFPPFLGRGEGGSGTILHHLRNPGMMIPPQIPTNCGFPWFQSGARSGFRNHPQYWGPPPPPPPPPGSFRRLPGGFCRNHGRGGDRGGGGDRAAGWVRAAGGAGLTVVPLYGGGCPPKKQKKKQKKTCFFAHAFQC